MVVDWLLCVGKESLDFAKRVDGTTERTAGANEAACCETVEAVTTDAEQACRLAARERYFRRLLGLP